ncbi:MAG: hypothetical protein BGO07_00805 [Alphaproteobacteria bacterium 40-19]|nr:MAG: hypothetical protein BGO07_00805 [Alphaproteobacteria bacterium 40-19]
MKVLGLAGWAWAWMTSFFGEKEETLCGTIDVIAFKGRGYDKIKADSSRGLVDIIGPVVCTEEVIEDCQFYLKNGMEKDLLLKNVTLSNEEKNGLEKVIESGIGYWVNQDNTEIFNHEGMSFSYKPLKGQIWKCIQWESPDFSIIVNGHYKNCKKSNDLQESL